MFLNTISMYIKNISTRKYICIQYPEKEANDIRQLIMQSCIYAYCESYV